MQRGTQLNFTSHTLFVACEELTVPWHRCAGLPVFVCVPGWVEEGEDPRHVWGGSGCLEVKAAGGGLEDVLPEEPQGVQKISEDEFEVRSP
jgi:hypothetical protein